MSESVMDLGESGMKLFKIIQGYALSQGYKIVKADWNGLLAAGVITTFENGVVDFVDSDWRYEMVDFLETLGADRWIKANRRQNILDYPS